MENEQSKSAQTDTLLAEKRTMLAAIRTFLANIRTSLVSLSLAFAFMKLDKENPIDVFTILLFCASGIFLILGCIDYFMTKKAVERIKE